MTIRSTKLVQKSFFVLLTALLLWQQVPLRGSALPKIAKVGWAGVVAGATYIFGEQQGKGARVERSPLTIVDPGGKYPSNCAGTLGNIVKIDFEDGGKGIGWWLAAGGVVATAAYLLYRGRETTKVVKEEHKTTRTQVKSHITDVANKILDFTNAGFQSITGHITQLGLDIGARIGVVEKKVGEVAASVDRLDKKVDEKLEEAQRHATALAATTNAQVKQVGLDLETKLEVLHSGVKKDIEEIKKLFEEQKNKTGAFENDLAGLGSTLKKILESQQRIEAQSKKWDSAHRPYGS